MLLSILVPKARFAIPLQAYESWKNVMHHITPYLVSLESYKSTMIAINLHRSFIDA